MEMQQAIEVYKRSNVAEDHWESATAALGRCVMLVMDCKEEFVAEEQHWEPSNPSEAELAMWSDELHYAYCIEPHADDWYIDVLINGEAYLRLNGAWYYLKDTKEG